MYELGNKMAPVLQLGEELAATAPPPPQELAPLPIAPLGKNNSNSDSRSTSSKSAATSNPTTAEKRPGEGSVESSSTGGSEEISRSESGALMRI